MVLASMYQPPRSFHRERTGVHLLLVVALAVLPTVVSPAVQAPQAVQVELSGQLAPPRHVFGRGLGNRALDRRIDKIISTNDAQRGFWGIEVVQLSSSKLLYERNADRLFIPASNAKLFTTAAALEKLGPGYVFRTTVESDAVPDAQGRVPNLYLVGRGDPDLGARTFPYSYHGPATASRTDFYRTWLIKSGRGEYARSRER